VANGQQKALQNLEAFQVWQATQTHDDFQQIIVRGQLNRGEVAKAVGCGKSALTQNPALKKALALLEENLREKGVLPPLKQPVKNSPEKPKQYDNTVNLKQLNSKRLSTLESENIELKAKVNELENKLKRYGELSETLYEMGIMPR
tara:strand:+ start:8350 stop:8787 length:438 start_codon:yes stop_codon:yes gene_type:complete